MRFLALSITLIFSLNIAFQGVQAVSITDYYTGKDYEFINTPTAVALDPNIKVTVNSTSVSDGDYVQVSWSGVKPTANGTDYVAVLTPGDLTSITTKAPSKYINVAQKIPDFNQTGAGSYTFELISSRASFRFVYLQGYYLYPVIKAYSPEIQLVNPNKPLHQHLGVTGKVGEVSVQWNTRDKCGKEIVYYGLQPNQLNLSAPAAFSNYYTSKDVCGPVCSQAGFVDPGYTHNVILSKLQPNTVYYYKAGSDEVGFGFTDVTKFRTPNAVGPDEQVYFFATADVGSNEADNSSLTQNEPAARMNYEYLQRDLKANDKYNLYHLHGDIAYADGQLTIWDNYFSLWSDFLKNIAIVVTEGNHERDYPNSGDRFVYSSDNSGGECGVPTYNNFYTPNYAVNKSNLWYSYEYGPIHFTHYSTERPFNAGTPQYDFLVKDINSVDRRKTPWLILAGHRPFYSPSPANFSQEDDTGTVAAALQAALEDTVYNNHVDMVWYGHVHRYERTCPTYKNACIGYDKDGVPNGPIYYDMGNGGYSLSRTITPPVNPIYTTNGGKIILANGYTRLAVNRTTLVQEMIYAANGTLMDTTIIKKPQNWGDSYMKSKGR